MADSILDFLKISPRLFEHEKTFALADLMNLSALETWPRIVLLWAWAAKHSPTEGDVTFLAEAGQRHGVLARVLELQSNTQLATDFFDGMIKIGFIDEKESRFFLHDWADGIGGFFIENERKRIAARNRMKVSRERSPNVPRTLHEHSRLNEMNCTEMNGTEMNGTNISDSNESLVGKPPDVSGEKKTRRVKTTEEIEKENSAFQDVIDLYHAKTPFPKIEKIRTLLKAHLRARLRENPDFDWSAFFERVGKSEFFTGQTTGFQASLFWLLGPKNFEKVNAGSYDGNSKTAKRISEEAEMELDPNVLTVERMIELCREICYGVPGFKAPLLPREMDESARWKFQKTKKLIQEKIREHPTVEYWKAFFKDFSKTDYFNGGLYHLLKKENGK